MSEFQSYIQIFYENYITMNIQSYVDSLRVNTVLELLQGLPHVTHFVDLVRTQQKLDNFGKEGYIYIPINDAILDAIDKMRITHEQFKSVYKFDEQIDFHFQNNIITQDDYGNNFNVLATFNSTAPNSTVYIIDRLLNVRNLGTVISSDNAYDGYTLFSPMRQGNTFMIDNKGDTVHTWYGNSPVLNTYLINDGPLAGKLMRAVVHADNTGNLVPSEVRWGGAQGVLEVVDFNSQVLFRYTLSGEYDLDGVVRKVVFHHDYSYRSVTNSVFLLNWVYYDYDECVKAGRDPALMTENVGIGFEQVIEIPIDITAKHKNILTDSTVLLNHVIAEQCIDNVITFSSSKIGSLSFSNIMIYGIEELECTNNTNDDITMIFIIHSIDDNGNVEWSSKWHVSDSVTIHPGKNIIKDLLISTDFQHKHKSYVYRLWCLSKTTPSAENTLTFDKITVFQTNEIEGYSTAKWIWNQWDHMVQDRFPDKLNYVNSVYSQNNNCKLDFNYPDDEIDFSTGQPDVKDDIFHANALDWNEEQNEVMISVRGYHELWVINKNTNNIVYRWGNTKTYNDKGMRVLDGQHNTHWITVGKDKGKIMLFDNGQLADDQSIIRVIEPEYNNDGTYKYDSKGVFLPYDSKNIKIQKNLLSDFISGCQRLPNEHTLACCGPVGTIIEFDENYNVVWRYTSPYEFKNMNMVEESQSGTLGYGQNMVFRALKYPKHNPQYNERFTEYGTQHVNVDHSETDKFIVQYFNSKSFVVTNKYNQIYEQVISPSHLYMTYHIKSGVFKNCFVSLSGDKNFENMGSGGEILFLNQNSEVLLKLELFDSETNNHVHHDIEFDESTNHIYYIYREKYADYDLPEYLKNGSTRYIDSVYKIKINEDLSTSEPIKVFDLKLIFQTHESLRHLNDKNDLTHANGISIRNNKLLISCREIASTVIYNMTTGDYEVMTNEFDEPIPSLKNGVVTMHQHSSEWINDEEFSVFINQYKYVGTRNDNPWQNAIFLYKINEQGYFYKYHQIILPYEFSWKVTSGAYKMQNSFLVTSDNNIYEVDMQGNILFHSKWTHKFYKTALIYTEDYPNMLPSQTPISSEVIDQGGYIS